MFFFFFLNEPAPPEIYPLPQPAALPFSVSPAARTTRASRARATRFSCTCTSGPARSEEHTSELQSQSNLVCRLLLEKKKKPNTIVNNCLEELYKSLETSTRNKLPVTTET